MSFGDILAQKDGMFTRGVLLDIRAMHGVDWLNPDDGVYAKVLRAAEVRQGIKWNPATAFSCIPVGKTRSRGRT